MSPFIAMAADLLIAVLLVATILTCLRLSRRMAALKSDETAMRATIGELMAATDAAERAISGLRLVVGEGDRNVSERLRVAERCAADLNARVAAGEGVIARLEQIASASRKAFAFVSEPKPNPSEPKPNPVADSLSAASLSAHAVAERAARRLGRAA